jgi:hypothetical protein
MTVTRQLPGTDPLPGEFVVVKEGEIIPPAAAGMVIVIERVDGTWWNHVGTRQFTRPKGM